MDLPAWGSSLLHIQVLYKYNHGTNADTELDVGSWDLREQLYRCIGKQIHMYRVIRSGYSLLTASDQQSARPRPDVAHKVLVRRCLRWAGRSTPLPTQTKPPPPRF
jgi:hypothetical protein